MGERERAVYYNISTFVATKPQGRGHWTRQRRSKQFWKQWDVWKRWVILPGPWELYLLFHYHRPINGLQINLDSAPLKIIHRAHMNKTDQSKDVPIKGGGLELLPRGLPPCHHPPTPQSPEAWLQGTVQELGRCYHGIREIRSTLCWRWVQLSPERDSKSTT